MSRFDLGYRDPYWWITTTTTQLAKTTTDTPAALLEKVGDLGKLSPDELEAFADELEAAVKALQAERERREAQGVLL